MGEKVTSENSDGKSKFWARGRAGMDVRKNSEGHIDVLILEDNPADAELIQLNIQASWPNARLVHINTREGYLEALEEGNCNLILSDYDVPQFSEDESLQLAKKFAPRCPFIYVSGVLNRSLAAELIERGAHGFVSKNDIGILADKIVELLGRDKASL